MTGPAEIPKHIEGPASSAVLRLEAEQARARSLLPDRTDVERARDLKIAKAFEGLADNREYLDRQK